MGQTDIKTKKNRNNLQQRIIIKPVNLFQGNTRAGVQIIDVEMRDYRQGRGSNDRRLDNRF